MKKTTATTIAGLLLASNVGTGLAIDSQNKAELQLAKEQFKTARTLLYREYENGLAFETKDLWIQAVQIQSKLCDTPLENVTTENLADKLNESLLRDC